MNSILFLVMPKSMLIWICLQNIILCFMHFLKYLYMNPTHIISYVFLE